MKYINFHLTRGFMFTKLGLAILFCFSFLVSQAHATMDKYSHLEHSHSSSADDSSLVKSQTKIPQKDTKDMPCHTGHCQYQCSTNLTVALFSNFSIVQFESNKQGPIGFYQFDYAFGPDTTLLRPPISLS